MIKPACRVEIIIELLAAAHDLRDSWKDVTGGISGSESVTFSNCGTP